MKKIKFLPLFVMAISFMAISCTKEGPEGPAGATGPAGPTGSGGSTGPTGPAGATGTANVIYSAWAAVSTMGTVADSVITDFGTCKRFIRTAPSLTTTILNTGVILSYWRLNTVIYSPLPYVFPVGTQTYLLSSIPQVGKIVYFTSIFGAAPSAGWSPNASAELRYVLIPGGVGGGFWGGIGGTNFTEEQIKGMTYEEVCQLFNIPETGEGSH